MKNSLVDLNGSKELLKINTNTISLIFKHLITFRTSIQKCQFLPMYKLLEAFSDKKKLL